MKDGVDQIHRSTLPTALVDSLRQLIVEGELAPGSKVNEAALCARFDVSRTPLREALRTLETEGLIVLRPRRGAMVAEFTQAELDQAFPVLAALEALAGELACPNLTDADLNRARALQEELEASWRDGDLHRYGAANAETHALILNAAENPTLTRSVRTLDARVRRARVLVNMAPSRWAAAVAEHRDILAAMEARDAARLSTVLKRHITNKLLSLRAQLRERGEG
ncbi:MAG: GntR family transcriptional regulator [Pseudomonadota bacterium]